MRWRQVKQARKLQRAEEEKAGRVEWIETSVGGDLGQKDFCASQTGGRDP